MTATLDARDSHPALAEAPDRRPVFRCPMRHAWVVTGYDDVAAVVSDSTRYSSADVLRPMGAVCPAAQQVLAGGYRTDEMRSLIVLDPPEHGPVRRLVASAFTPRRVAGLEPRIRAIAEGLVDGFAADGEVDLVARFAYPLPLAVIMELLEIPAADREVIKGWSDDRVALTWGDLALTEALQTGQPQSEIKHTGRALFDELYSDPVKLEVVMDAMTGFSLGNLRVLAEKFDFSPWETLCDIGGATGQLCRILADRHPHLRYTSFDLPAVEPIAQRAIAAAGMSDKVGTAAGDFFVDPLPRADVITMGMILNDWNP